MLKFFVSRPITTLMFVLFWVVLGLAALPKINVERAPAVDFPMITTTFVYPGAAPAEIESQVIKRAEDAISEVSGLKKLTSKTYDNGGYVMAEFNLGVNVDDKSNEIKAKIDALANDFPDALREPVVEKLNPLQESVVDITLTGAESRDLQEYAENVLSNKITAIKGVASVSVFGGEKRAIRVELNPDLMASRGATVMDIVSALGARNLNVPGGKIEVGTNSSTVRFVGEFASVEEIANLGLTTVEGQKFKLGDVAQIIDSARDIETGARYDGKSVIIMSVVKASDGNAIKISSALRKQMPDLISDLQTRFPNGQMEIISDSSENVSEETTSTIWGIVLGILFTVLVLLAFTQNWRSTIIAGAVIPASLIAGLFFVSNSGFTINVMTLLAYSSALGTLVSNAIILIESALQEMKTGKNPDDAAIDGTKKVAVSVLAGVGTNVVVFLPLAFMGGIAGKFMVQFGLTVVYLTILSLMFSFTLTPMMIAKFLRLAKPSGNAAKKTNDKTQTKTRLHKWFDFQHAHPWTVIMSSVAILFGSMMLMKFVGNEFAPSTDTNEITITARAPMGSTFEKSESIVKSIEEKLSLFPDVKSISAKIGERGLQNITIKLTLTDLSERDISDKELARRMMPELATIPDAEIQISAGQSVSSSTTSDMVLNINGEDDAKREAYASQAIEIINQIPEVQSAVRAQMTPGRETRFIPDEDKMNFWGINNSYAGTTLRTALFGNDDYKYKENGEEYPIILEFARAFKTPEMFDRIYVNSPKGMVALSELGSVQNIGATPDISRIDKNRITEIDVNLGKSTLGPVQKKVEAGLKKIQWDEGYGYSFGGMSEIQDETTGEIGMAFMLATVLTFMLLAAIMNSLVHPFTIATSIITSFAGVFVLLFLSGASMNIGSMLAFVMLVGLVVNNNILVLEPTIRRISSGEDAQNALWTELNAKRAMILMTSIAVMTGMLPQLWSNDGMKSAMAAVMIGGMLASMIWTFTLTPALFFVMERARQWAKKHF